MTTSSAADTGQPENVAHRRAFQVLGYVVGALGATLVLTLLGAKLGVPHIGELLWGLFELVRELVLLVYNSAYAVLPILYGVLGIVWLSYATRRPFLRHAYRCLGPTLHTHDKIGLPCIAVLFCYQVAFGQEVGQLVFGSTLYATAYCVGVFIALFPFSLWVARNLHAPDDRDLFVVMTTLLMLGGYSLAGVATCMQIGLQSEYVHYLQASSGQALLFIGGSVVAVVGSYLAAWWYASTAGETPIHIP